MFSVQLLKLTKLLDKLSKLALWLLLVGDSLVWGVFFCLLLFVCFSNIERLICARTHGHALIYL